MAVNSDFLLNALLCHNYLPTQRKHKEELPPIFSTSSFTPDAARDLATLNYRKGTYSGYDQLEYKLTRFNNVSRILSIPHPLPHSKLCLTLYEHWEKLEYITINPNSQIKPQSYTDGRVLIMNGYSDSTEKANKQLNHAFGMRYRVNTDIANCFPSIYSHAVPWALVGHQEAKQAKHEKDAWFNQIDKHLRNCNREETQGVAIGPGASNIISELIFARIDDALRKDFSFTRYIDDYVCHCESEERAEEFIRRLEQEAGKFKLHLNIKKTKTVRLPQPVTDSWVVELAHHIPIGEELSSFEVFRFLDIAVKLAESHPEASVLKYASSIISNKKYKFGDDVEVLNYLLSLTFFHPVLLPVISKPIVSSYLHFDDSKIDLYGTSEKLEAIVFENARQNRSDGMCWGLYYLGIADSSIPEEIANAIIKTGDALAILALFWASEAYREAIVEFCYGLDKNDLYQLDRYWILLYQLALEGLIEDPYKDGVFDKLMEYKVNFLLPKHELTGK